MSDEVASRVGEIFEIELREPATAGYRWSIDRLPPEVHLVDDQRDTAVVGRSGSALNHKFRLRASEPGDFQITFALRRPWEQQSAEVKTMKVTTRE
jgi:predicted secreted protein